MPLTPPQKSEQHRHGNQQSIRIGCIGIPGSFYNTRAHRIPPFSKVNP